jgi:cell wall-associated NlpC family hydrolase
MRVRAKKFVLLFPIFLLVALAGCAPKVIKVYEGPPGPPQKGDAIVQYASGFIGRPYKSGAKGPDAFDCSGFVYFVYKRHEINVPYTTDELVRTGYQISRETVLCGDLVVFTIKRSYHIGIMMNEREFLHASASKGIAVGNLELPYWRRSFSHFRRVM